MPYDTLGRLLALCIGMGWSITAWAAASDAVDLIGMPWMQIGLGIVLSTWGGLASTAQRLVALARNGVVTGPVWPGILSDVLASSGAGFVMYALGAWQDWDRSVVSVVLFLGGYAGTRLLEPVTAAIVDRVVDVLKRLGVSQ